MGKVPCIRSSRFKKAKNYKLSYNHWVPLTNGICKYTIVLQHKEIKHSLLNNLEAL